MGKVGDEKGASEEVVDNTMKLMLNPFHTNPLAVVCGSNISAPDGARRLFFFVRILKIAKKNKA